MIQRLQSMVRRVALQIGTWLVAWAAPPADAILSDPVSEAVRSAFLQCGLPAHHYARDFNLARTGKLYEVLHYASLASGIDHELRTVGDVIAFLRTP